MKMFNITVNGTAYQVEVEEVGGACSAAPKVAAPVAAPKVAAPVAAPKAAPVAAAPVAAGATTVSSPMPGKILSIACAKGDAVNSGDVLLILEAMKMENEIMAPAAGTVTDIRVTVGQTVSTGDVMIVL